MSKMENIEINYIKFLEANLSNIYSLLNKTFGINKSEFKIIITSSVKLLQNSFFQDVISHTNLDKCYNEIGNSRLRESFESVDIEQDLMKKIIIQCPEILLFSNMPENINYLFKANDLKAIVLVFGESYDCKLIDDFDLENKIKLKKEKVITCYHNNEICNKHYINKTFLVSKLLDSAYYDDKLYNKKVNYFDELLRTLNREDIMNYYNLDIDSTLADKINALTERYNKRNFYIKKKSK